MKMSPFNMNGLLDVDQFIQSRGIGEITSHSMFSPSSTSFHPEGLYSEEIFGKLGSKERLGMSNFGYINLKSAIIHPYIYKIIISLKKSYEGIVSGRTYAIFSEEQQDFVPCMKNTEGSDTGYSFFIEHVFKINFRRTSSIKRDKKIMLLEKHTDKVLFLKRMLVSPVGMRDVQFDENGMTSSEEINKLYLNILSLSQALPPELDEDLIKLYDGVRYSIQKKALEIWEYIWNMFKGKRGFAQNRHASRAIALGARNVVSAANLETMSPDDDDYLKHDETLLPLYQMMKMFVPIIVQKIKYIFIAPFFSMSSSSVPLINPKNYNIEYVDLTDKEIARWNSSEEGITQLINLYENDHIRSMPVTIQGVNNKRYYLMLVYDTGDSIYYLRNIEDFKAQLLENNKEIFDMKYIRPLTYMEMFYFAAMDGASDKHVVITRYPAIEAGSIYPSRIQISTTIPARKVKLKYQASDQDVFKVLPRYPIIANPHIDSVAVHPSKVVGLGADHDGDMLSTNGVMSLEANVENAKHLRSTSSILALGKKFQSSISNNLTKVFYYNLTK